MRANRKMRELTDDKAEVGIGTMIVFIATVLVAAIAAGVLLDTSGKLQERSSETGRSATEQVASNLYLDSVTGHRNATTDANLLILEFYVGLAPGAASVDLAQLKIQWVTDDNSGQLSWNEGIWGEAGQFTADEIRDVDGSFTAGVVGATPVMTEGDYVRINIAPQAQSPAMALAVREHATFLFQPEVGVPFEYAFTTPSSYGSNLHMELR